MLKVERNIHDEETALAILITNLKGAKRKRDDWLTIAESCRFLRQKYGSIKKVADRVAVAQETLREIEKLLDLPDEVKQQILNGAIGFKTGYEISKIPDKTRQVEAGEVVANMGYLDARAITDYARRNPHMTVEDCRRRVIETKTITEKLHLVVVPFEDEVFQKLAEEAKNQNIPLDELINNVIKHWLEQKPSQS